MKKSLILASIAAAALPQMIGLYQFLHNGGMQWPMLWSNEKTAWGLLVAPLGVLPAVYSLRLLKTEKVFTTFAFLLCCVVVYPSVHDYFAVGLSASSKNDDQSLHMAQFWASGWWE